MPDILQTQCPEVLFFGFVAGDFVVQESKGAFNQARISTELEK
jgi:hypothetical protein